MVELIESGKKQIVVDLSKATFIDSTTLGVLVGGVKRLRPAGGSLALVCTDDNITKISDSRAERISDPPFSRGSAGRSHRRRLTKSRRGHPARVV